jgi:hypothetical protein
MCELETGNLIPYREPQPHSKGKNGQGDDTQYKGGIRREAALIIMELVFGCNPIREDSVNHIDNREDQ